jgi:hypothetical protein
MRKINWAKEILYGVVSIIIAFILVYLFIMWGWI